MIDFIEGNLAENAPTHVVVDVHGVGFHLNTPMSTYRAGRQLGAPVRLRTYLQVREDALTLFGFETEAERQAFLLLIGVSGVGPQLAQKILSGVPFDEFTRLVADGDAKGLTRIKGVGQKTAQRLVLELKDRVAEIGVTGRTAPAERGNGRVDEALAALVGLGANAAQARKVLDQVVEKEGDLTVEELIKSALRAI